MATKISLTKENTKYLRYAFAHFFPDDSVYSADKPFFSGEFNWRNRQGFIDFVYRLTGVSIKSDKDFQNIKKAQLAVEELVEESRKETEANVQTEEQREQAEKIRQEREASEKEAAKTAKEKVEASKEKQEALAKETRKRKAIEEAKTKIREQIKTEEAARKDLQGKKIYAKIETQKKAPAPNENTINFIKEAKAHPQKFEKDLAQNIKDQITPALSSKLSEEEIGFLAEKTAFDTVYAINNLPAQSSINTQVAILKSLPKDTKVLAGLDASDQAKEVLKNSANELAFFKDNIKTSKQILSSINSNLALSVFGTDTENIEVTFSETPMEGYTHEVDLGQLNEGHLKLLSAQSGALDGVGSNVSSFVSDRGRSFLMGRARDLLDSQVSKLPADSAVSGFYNSKFGQEILNFAGLGKANPLGEGFLVNITRQIPGGSAFLESLGSTFGIDFGVSIATPTVEAATTLLTTEGASLVGEAIVGGIETGVVTAAETVAVAGTEVALEAAATAASGPAAPVTAIVMAAIEAAKKIGKWVAKHINWPKIKENLVAISGGLLFGGLVIFPGTVMGTVMSVAGGVGMVGGIINGGLSAVTSGISSLVGGIGAFLGAIGTAFIGAVGIPILVTLLAFPVIVAFILFVINSGAYIVPPGSETFANIINPYIEVTKTPVPAGPFENTSLPLTVEYQITITAKKDGLKNIRLAYECGVVKEGPKVECPKTDPVVPSTINDVPSGDSYSFSYTQEYSAGNFEDSLVVDTLLVTADTTVQTDVKSSASAGIKIGDPPDSCPSIWPVNGTHPITTGPFTPGTHGGVEAIDIGSVGYTTPVIATHTGIASIPTTGGPYGNYIEITSVCGGKSVTTRYAHLSGVSISAGQVLMGQTIGITGSTGNSTGPHLHYEFVNNVLQMVYPFIPKTIERNCSDPSATGLCGTIP